MTWTVYPGHKGDIAEDAVSSWLSDPPPWRDPGEAWDTRTDRVQATPPDFVEGSRSWKRARHYVTSNGDKEVQHINMALLLRRPLLVRGAPGLGKSSIAYSIAWRLGLGRPLRWEIGSQTTLSEGLYAYDAVGHLQDSRKADNHRPLGDFFTLGPLGTALLPTRLPRVLLIDELDKASYDLPNDLLHVLEEGAFAIPELVREGGVHQVHPADTGWARAQDGPTLVSVHGGMVHTHHHPVVVITTNNEREFPEAFRRRCVELTLERPRDPKVVQEILRQWFGPTELDGLERLDEYASIDALLQALYLDRRRFPRDAVRNGLAQAGRRSR